MKIPFKYYLHEDKMETWNFFRAFSENYRLSLDKEALDQLQWSFYEIELACELDTETLTVTIVSAN